MKQKLTLLFSCFLFTSSLCFAQKIPDKEYQVLVNFYNSIKGLDWDVSQNNVNEGNWTGVKTSNGHVVSINLENKGLKGRIPASIGDLDSLEILNLYNNAIEGKIPQTCVDLKSLKTLNLGYNKINDIEALLPSKVSLSVISQALTVDAFNYEGKDVVIDLPRICLYNRSTNTFDAKNIFYFRIDGNNIGTYITASANGKLTIPKEYMKSLKSSSKVSIYQTGGTAFYSTINYTNTVINQAQIPDSEYQALVEFFSSMGGTKWRTKWDVSKNNLNEGAWYGIGITDGHITEINLPSNYLNGKIPASIQQLKYLTTLDLSSNDSITEVPASISKLENLKEINFYATKLKYQTLDAIFSIQSLTDLNLSSTSLSGSIPASIGLLKNIKTLNLFNNKFEGIIIPEISSLTSLETLNLSNNLLDGSIPKDLEKLSNLKTANLQYNRFNDIQALLPSSVSLSVSSQALTVDAFNYEGKDVVIDLPRICLYNRSSNAFDAKNNFYFRIDGNNIGTYITASANGKLTIPKEYMKSLKSSNKVSIYQTGGTAVYSTINYTNTVINQVQIPDSEYQALVEFFSSMGGTKWQTKWDVSKNNLNEGAWYGIGITDGHITEINLNNNRLGGQIPASIQQLKYLTTLDLSSNDSITEVPASISKLENLKEINFHATKLKYQTLDAIFSIQSLTDLNLSSTSLSGSISASIGLLKNIKTLNLSNNKFEGIIIPEISSLTSLETLNLSSNLLDGSIPKDLEKLSNLKTANLQYNRFNDIQALLPSSVSLSVSSQALTVDAFNYEGKDVLIDLPRICLYNRSTNTFDAKNTFYFHIDGNNIGTVITASTNGKLTIPKEYMASLKSNSKVSIYQTGGIAVYSTINYTNTVINQVQIPDSEYQALVEFFSSMGGTKWRIKWDVSKNNLNEGAWYGIGITDGHITEINLSSNYLNGKIPASIQQLKYLTTLNLSYNDSITEIPASISKLENLKEINFYATKLKYQTLDAIFSIQSLTDLNLSSTSLSGSIPASIGLLKNIKTLNLSNNKFEGIIIPEISSLTSLETLNLSSNLLDGSIPKDLEKLSNLKTANLQYNRFNDIQALLPSSVSLSVSSQALTVDAFNYEGKDVVIDLPRICLYNRSSNTFDAKNSFYFQVDGTNIGTVITTSTNGKLTIPKEYMASLKSSSKVSLYQAGGIAVYSTINYTNTIIDSILDVDKEEYQALVDLYNATNGPTWNNKWDISQNNIHKGGWYGVISDKGHIVSLDLSYNNLLGQLPTSLGKLKYLKNLNLSYNRLTGNLPQEFNGMIVLERLNVSVNSLDGSIPKSLESLEHLKNIYLSENKFTDIEALFNSNVTLDVQSQTIELPELKLDGNDVMVMLPRICLYDRTSNTFSAENKFDFFVDQKKYTLTADALGKITIPDSCLLHVDQDATVYFKQLSGTSNDTRIRFKKTTPNQVKVSDEEFKLLVDLYNATEGQNWKNQWDVAQNNINEGDWYGILSSNGHITEINLSNNNLSGNLPDTIISKLSELKVVKLADNNLTGSVSDKFNQLIKLNTLDLSGNKLNNITQILPQQINLKIEKQTIDQGTLALTMDATLFDNPLNRYNHSAGKFEDKTSYILTINNTSRTVSINDQGLGLVNLMNTWNIPNNTLLELKQQTGSAVNSIINYTLTYKKGDSNFDDVINILDAQHTINYIIGSIDRPFNYAAANLNVDGKIDLLDIVLLIEEIQKNAIAESDMETLRSSNAEAALSIENGILYLESYAQPTTTFDIRLQGIHKNEIVELLSDKNYTISVNENGTISAISGFTLGEGLLGKVAIARVNQSATIESALLSDSQALKISLTIKNATGILPVSLEKSNIVFNTPNPFNESTTIIYNVASGVSKAVLRIYNNQGQLIKTSDLEISQGKHEIELNLSGYPSGIYHSVVEMYKGNEKNNYNHKLIKK